MTILITDPLRTIIRKEDDLAAKLRKDSKGEPITTLYKVRSGNTQRLLMKAGRNNFICMQDKHMYRLKHHGCSGIALVLAKDDSVTIPVHDFAIQIAFLKLK